MTHPNIVFMPWQRITQGNIGSFTGSIPTKYSKSIYLLFLHRDALRVVCDASRGIFMAL